MNGLAKSGTLKGTRQAADDLQRRTAAYPEEIVDRLIRMFSVKGEIVLDPFLGSGTTVKVAIKNERSSIGYENDNDLFSLITQKISIDAGNVEIIKR